MHNILKLEKLSSLSFSYLILFVCILFQHKISYSQSKYIDSLSQLYFSATEIKTKKQILINLCENYRMLPIDKFDKFTNEFENLAIKSNTLEDKLLADLYRSVYFLKVGKGDSCFNRYQKNKDDLPKFASIYPKFLFYIGNYYVKNNQHKEAFDHFYKALKLVEENNDTLYMVYAKAGIGWAHMEMNQMNKAINWFNSTLITTSNFQFQKNYAAIYTNLAACYGALGKYDTARFYCQKALALGIGLNDLVSQANANFILGNLYMVDDQFHDAEMVFMEGYRIHKIIGDPFFIVSDMADIALHFSNTKQFDKGIAMAKEAIEYAVANKLDAKLLICYDALQNNYKEAGQFKLQAECLSIMNSLRDSVYRKTSEHAVAEMNTKYETEIKEKTIQKQQFEISKKNYLLFGGLGFFLLLGVLVFLLYRNHAYQQEKHLQFELIKQQDLSTKAVIEAEENERKRIAADLHDGVGQMLTAVKMNLEGLTDRIMIANPEDKNVYEKVKLLLEESCKEVRNVSHNIMPNALLKSGLGTAIKDFIEKVNNEKLQINLSVTGIHEKLSSSIEIVVYRVIQECVNNVIKHSKADRLDIAIIKDIDGLNVTIEDNGSGFNLSNLSHAKGIGMRNIRTRIEYLKGSLDIDTKPGKGTLIAFNIPIIEE